MSRHKQHAGRVKGVQHGPDAHRIRIEKLFERGNAKDAFKEAKLLFRQDETPQNRQLVERTYLERVKSLIAGGMTESAREVAGNFLEFGVSHSGYMQELLLLLPSVGLSDRALALQDRVVAPDALERLVTQFADRAVLHPEDSASFSPEICEAAGKVRQALDALEANDEPRALELLQAIPRSSPLADWRYFVRGLAAFRRGDTDQTSANWQRLDPQRAAHRISLALLPPVEAGTSQASPARLAKLEVGIFGEPLLERLGQLKTALQAGDWKRVHTLVGPLQRALRRVDVRWSTRLTEILLEPLANAVRQRRRDETTRMLREFTSLLEPLPWDPHWNRFLAVASEGCGDNKALEYWWQYLRDLEAGCPAPGGDARRVQALVWRQIGQILEREDVHFELPPGLLNLLPTRELYGPNSFTKLAIHAFEACIRLDPMQRNTYDSLMELYDANEQPERVAATATRLLAAYPDDVAVLRRLVELHLRRDEPESALPYVERLRALQPLASELTVIESTARMSLARHFALQGHFREGREQLARAQTPVSPAPVQAGLLIRRAMLEFLAHKEEEAEGLIKQAQATFGEPVVLGLWLAIEAIRYKIAKPLQKRLQQQFKSASARKATGAAASGLAKTMLAHLSEHADYPGRAGHVTEVLAYLGRTTRTKYSEEELMEVCLFLDAAEKVPLLEKFVRRGVKSYPKSPFFLHQSAQLEIERGPFACDVAYAHKQLTKALELAQASQIPRDQRLIPIIKETLSQIGDVHEAMKTFPGRLPRNPREMEAMMAAMMGEFQDDDDDDDDDIFDYMEDV
jgi:tetratricopeptide (TPR) repeat protein